MNFINIISLISIICVTSCSGFEETLRQTHILFRHGDRNPITLTKNDPYQNQLKYWPEGMGELTLKGQAMLYNLGHWLRTRYGSFVEETFDTREVHVVSTDYDRTLMSAQANMASLFIPPKNDRIEVSVPWRPTPIHSWRQGTDMLMNVDASCPRIAEEVRAMKKLPEVQRFHDERTQIFSDLSRLSGSPMSSLMEVAYLYDSLIVERFHGLPLPDWTQFYMDAMKEIVEFNFMIDTMTPELKRLRGGPLIKQMTNDMKNMASNETTMKMFLYAGHDNVIANFLNSMGAFNMLPPPYASTVLVELHEVNGSYNVQLQYYNDTEKGVPYPLSIHGCEHICPLEDWERILSPVIPTDWIQECHESKVLQKKTIWLALAGGTLVLLLVAAGLVVRRTKRHKTPFLPTHSAAAEYGAIDSVLS